MIKAKNYYPCDSNNNHYIEQYHIDTKEGLIILLTELEFSYKLELFSDEDINRRQQEILSEVNKLLLERSKASLTVEDWLKSNPIYKIAGISLSKYSIEYLFSNTFMKKAKETEYDELEAKKMGEKICKFAISQPFEVMKEVGSNQFANIYYHL